MHEPRWRQPALARQGLASAQPFGNGQQGTLKAIEHLGYVQIDALSVVERAHHHTLWARIPGYEPAYLGQLLHERQIFEYWSHAAAYLPMRDYRFALPRMNAIRTGEHPYFTNIDAGLMREILARVRDEGPLSVRAVGTGRSRNGSWWNWGPGRRALDKLFGFDYRLECYLPAAKRVYGYFCLPILFGDRFVGRIDCKAHRAERRFEVLNLHIEEPTVDKAEFVPLLDDAIRKFAAFNGCVYQPRESAP